MSAQIGGLICFLLWKTSTDINEKGIYFGIVSRLLLYVIALLSCANQLNVIGLL